MSSSKSKQSSKSQQASSGNTFLAGFQQPFLQGLFSQASQVQQSIQDPLTAAAQQLSGQLQGVGQGLLGGLQGAAQGLPDGLQNILAQLTGQQPSAGVAGQALPGQSTMQALAQFGGAQPNQFSQFISGENPAIQGQIGALDEAIQRNLQSTLGSIGGQATLAGQTGGGRQQLASGMAAGEAQRAFASGASGLLGQDYATRAALVPQLAAQQLQGQQLQLGAAQALDQSALAQGDLQTRLAALQQGGLQSAGNLLLQGQGQQLGAAQTGLGSLGDLFNLGLGGYQAAFSPLQSLAGILGPAILLSQQSSTGASKGSGSSFGFGF